MKKFVVRFLFFCLLPLPVLFILNHVVDNGLRKSRYSYYAEWNDLYDSKINADMLIMGSSRAWVQFSPTIIDSVLHLNSYNLGLDGSSFDLQYKRFKIYLQHNKKPKYVVQEVGYVATLAKSEILPGAAQFLPYLSDTTIWGIVKSSNVSFNVFDRYFPLYKYNNEVVLIKEGIQSYMGKGVAAKKYKGYEGQLKPWDSSFHDFVVNNPEGWLPNLDSDAVVEFIDFLNFCKANDIKIIMVYPPVYRGITAIMKKKDRILNKYLSFSATFGYPFLNYEDDTLCNSRAYFYNSQHLNKLGSEKFSLEFANDIKGKL